MGEAQDASEHLIACHTTDTAQSMVKDGTGIVDPPVQAYSSELSSEQRALLDNAIEQEPARFGVFNYADDYWASTRVGSSSMEHRYCEGWNVVEFTRRNPTDELRNIYHFYMQGIDYDYPDEGTNVAHYLDTFNEKCGGSQYRFTELMRDNGRDISHAGEEWNHELNNLIALAQKVKNETDDDSPVQSLCDKVMQLADDVKCVSVYSKDSLQYKHITADAIQNYSYASITETDDDDDFDEEDMPHNTVDNDGNYWTYNRRNDFTDYNQPSHYTKMERISTIADAYGVAIPDEGYDSDDHQQCTPALWNASMILVSERAAAERYKEKLLTGDTRDADEAIQLAELMRVEEVNVCDGHHDYDYETTDEQWEHWTSQWRLQKTS